MLKDVAGKILGREITKEDGIDILRIEEAETRLGVRLPHALREFYHTVGNIELFGSSHNRFAPLDEIYIEEALLFFLEENQSVCMWGVDVDELAYDNPAVYMVAETEEGEDAWTENSPLPEFLRMMMYFQACMGDVEDNGGYDYGGDREGLSEELINFLSTWEKCVDYSNFTVYFKWGNGSQLIWYRTGDEDESVYLICQDEDDYTAIADEFGFEEF